MAGNNNTFGLQPQQGGDLGNILDAYMRLVEDQTDQAREHLSVSRTVESAQKKYAAALGSAAKTLGSAFNVSPRQLIAATRGNISNTGRNVGIGAIAAGIGLAGAASPNGLSPLTSSMKYLAAVIGGALLPALLDVSAAIAALADRFAADGSTPKGDKISTKAAGGIAGAMMGGAAGAGIGSVIPGIGTTIGGVVGAGLGAFGMVSAAQAGEDKAKAEKGIPVKSFTDLFRENRELLLKGMLAGMGSKGLGGIADAAKKAQEAALGGGIEYKMLQAQLRSAQNTAKIAENTKGLNGAAS